jgi:uracil-DNA glycosylase family 4
MSRREEFLREMGLAPVWQLRRSPTVSAAPEAVPEAARDAKVQEEAPAQEPPGERVSGMQWPELKAAVAQCTACGLCKSRKNTVFGVGDESADWMIVGEAPGAEEDERGEPFVGQAGRLLDNMLASIGLSRGRNGQANVYIANVLKCRPPGNRNPDPAEVAKCAPYLMRQIELVQPKVILAMGRFAAQSLLDSDASISSMRGKAFRTQGVTTVVTYHPAYLLRSLPDKAKAWEDLCFARRMLNGTQA